MTGVNVGTGRGMCKKGSRTAAMPAMKRGVRKGHRQIDRLLTHAHPSSTSTVF